MRNLALAKPTKQSSQSLSRAPSRVVDGNRNTNYFSNSCSHTWHTTPNPGAWWQVDLGAVYEIHSVVITNRRDCCGKLIQTRLKCVNVTQLVIIKTTARQDTLKENGHINSMLFTYESAAMIVIFSAAHHNNKGLVIEVLHNENTHQCASVRGQFGLAETRRISCRRGTIGNIVKVRLTNSTTLCEVEVFGVNGKTKCCL